MAVNQIRRDEEPTALNWSSYQLNNIRRPRSAAQPSLCGPITKVEMKPDKIRNPRRDVCLSEVVHRLPQSATECKSKSRATVTHGAQS